MNIEDESNALRRELGKANKCYNELLSDFEKLKKEKAQLRIDNALLRRGFSPTASAEIERLRAALDKIAQMEHNEKYWEDVGMEAVDVAKIALGVEE